MASSPEAKPPSSRDPVLAVDVARASAEELADARKVVFRRLLGYIAPYRNRLAWGIFFGILAGAVNGFLVLVIRMVLDVVNTPEKVAEAYYPFEGMPFFSEFAIRPPSTDNPWTFVAAVCLSIPVLLLLRGVFPEAEMREACARLERGAGFDSMKFGPEFEALPGYVLPIAPELVVALPHYGNFFALRLYAYHREVPDSVPLCLPNGTSLIDIGT